MVSSCAVRPRAIHPLAITAIERVSKDVATKEVQLVGASSGSRTAAGGLNFTNNGAVPAGKTKEAET